MTATVDNWYSLEDKNRATSFEQELLTRLGRNSLGDVSETDLTDRRAF